MMDWLAKMLHLPKEFLACSGSGGGGVIQVNFIDNFMKRNKKVCIYSCEGREHSQDLAVDGTVKKKESKFVPVLP